MKNIIFIVFAFLSFVVVFGADCSIKGKDLQTGERYSPVGQCTQITCEEPGQISAIGCPDVQSLKPCKYIPTDVTKPYPSCCPQFQC